MMVHNDIDFFSKVAGAVRKLDPDDLADIRRITDGWLEDRYTKHARREMLQEIERLIHTIIDLY